MVAASLASFALPSLPRHDHPLQSRLRIIAARAIVEDGNAEPASPIAALTPQTKLQIEDERIVPSHTCPCSKFSNWSF